MKESWLHYLPSEWRHESSDITLCYPKHPDHILRRGKWGLTSVTMVEENKLWSYTQPSTQGSVSRSVMLGKVPFRWRSCHWGWRKRWHFSGFKFESSGMEILRRTSWLRSPVSLSETVALSRMWTQQQWWGTAAVKFSKSIWQTVIIREGRTKTIWRIWNFPRPPTSSRNSSKAIE